MENYKKYVATMRNKSFYLITISLIGISIFNCRTADKGQVSKDNSIKESRTLVNQALPSLDIPVDGNAIKAFVVAYDLFLKDEQIPIQKKSILQHNVKILKESDHYVVAFRAKRELSSLMNEYGNGTDTGVDVDYFIHDKSYTLQKRLFSH